AANAHVGKVGAERCPADLGVGPLELARRRPQAARDHTQFEVVCVLDLDDRNRLTQEGGPAIDCGRAIHVSGFSFADDHRSDQWYGAVTDLETNVARGKGPGCRYGTA